MHIEWPDIYEECKCLNEKLRKATMFNCQGYIGPVFKEENKVKVTYKGVTGELLKLERVSVEVVGLFPETRRVQKFNLEIEDAKDGHKHCFEKIDPSDIEFVGATVKLG